MLRHDLGPHRLLVEDRRQGDDRPILLHHPQSRIIEILGLGGIFYRPDLQHVRPAGKHAQAEADAGRAAIGIGATELAADPGLRDVEEAPDIVDERVHRKAGIGDGEVHSVGGNDDIDRFDSTAAGLFHLAQGVDQPR